MKKIKTTTLPKPSQKVLDSVEAIEKIQRLELKILFASIDTRLANIFKDTDINVGLLDIITINQP